MKVFVTGATGFVGKSVVKALRQREHEVVGLVRDASKGKALEQLGVTLAAESEAYGETYNVVDEQPLQLRELIDLFTDAMGKKRVGSMAPWLLKLIIGGPLVDSLVTSFRIRNEKAKRELGWQPLYNTFKEGLPGVIKALGPE